MDSVFDTIGKGAKYSAITKHKDALTLDDFAVGLYLLKDHKEFAIFFNGVVWPENIEKCALGYITYKAQKYMKIMTETEGSYTFYSTISKLQNDPKELVSFAVQHLIEASVLINTSD